MIENYYTIQYRVEDHIREMQLEADTQRIGRDRDLKIDTKNIRTHSQYLRRMLANTLNR